MPAVIAKCLQALFGAVPGQMIAGEQKPVLKQQHAMPFGVTRCGDREHLLSKLDGLFAVQYDFSPRLGGKLATMNDPPGAEMLGKPRRVGHIVAVRQKNM